MAYFFETRCRLWLAGGHGPQLMIIMKSTFIKRKFDKAAYALSADNVKEEHLSLFVKKCLSNCHVFEAPVADRGKRSTSVWRWRFGSADR